MKEQAASVASMALLRQLCPYRVCTAQELTAQVQWKIYSKGENRCIRPFALEIIKCLCKNKPYANFGDDGDKILLLVISYSKILLPGILVPPLSPPKRLSGHQTFFCMAAKTYGKTPQTLKFLDSQFLHSVCSWHLERRSNNYHEAHMARKGHLLCMN